LVGTNTLAYHDPPTVTKSKRFFKIIESRSISFVDGLGKNYGPFLRTSSSFDLVNLKTINFPSGQAPPFNAVSIFKFPI
jgi:hypothetical protein